MDQGHLHSHQQMDQGHLHSHQQMDQGHLHCHFILAMALEHPLKLLVDQGVRLHHQEWMVHVHALKIML
jgi:hypothetical protein